MMKQFCGALGAAILCTVLGGAASAADPASCATVRMADPGWTDITSTNAIAGVLLEGLGHEQAVQLIGVPIAFRSLQNDDIDVFLGNWMPAQTSMVEPLLAEKSAVLLTDNLSGLRFTLAVPSYIAGAGVKSVTDLAAHADRFDRKLYTIEPGSAVNENIRRMLDDGAFGLAGWEMVESSEQGMLGQVDRAVRAEEWILFIAWEPHPMNTKFDLTYLPGGDAYFGPNLGSATVRTLSRAGFPTDCPNLARLFSQLHFTKEMENEMMGAILDDGAEPEDAARDYLKAHPEVLEGWLAGVTTADGEDGLAAVKEELDL
jgi:glycine betaine/proline transport system substrate-binding protein